MRPIRTASWRRGWIATASRASKAGRATCVSSPTPWQTTWFADPWTIRLILETRARPLFALEEICRSAKQAGVTAGDTLLVGLRWRSLEETPDAYKVSLQLLNDRDQVIAQQDSEPGGGSLPTSAWQAGQRVEDNHGLWIPFGTPPGEYRLSLARLRPGYGRAVGDGRRRCCSVGASPRSSRQMKPCRRTLCPCSIV